jgi:hypothetical protein
MEKVILYQLLGCSDVEEHYLFGRAGSDETRLIHVYSKASIPLYPGIREGSFLAVDRYRKIGMVGDSLSTRMYRSFLCTMGTLYDEQSASSLSISLQSNCKGCRIIFRTTPTGHTNCANFSNPLLTRVNQTVIRYPMYYELCRNISTT